MMRKQIRGSVLVLLLPVLRPPFSVPMAQALKERGNACFSRRQFEQAEQWYTQALELSPQTPALYTNRAAAAAELGKARQDAATAARRTLAAANHTPARLARAS